MRSRCRAEAEGAETEGEQKSKEEVALLNDGVERTSVAFLQFALPHFRGRWNRFQQQEPENTMPFIMKKDTVKKKKERSLSWLCFRLLKRNTPLFLLYTPKFPPAADPRCAPCCELQMRHQTVSEEEEAAAEVEGFVGTPLRPTGGVTIAPLATKGKSF